MRNLGKAFFSSIRIFNVFFLVEEKYFLDWF